MGLPPARSPESARRACVVGIPFDCGTHPFRVGSRQGPDAIREQSRLLRPVDIFRRHGIDNPSEFLRAVDVGNVACHPGDPDASFPLIEAGIGAILDAGAIPISMGGDGAVTQPRRRAAPSDFAVLHFDSHTDTYPIRATTPPPPSRAAEEGLLDVARSFHVGTRGSSFMPGVLEFGREVGYTIVPFDDFDADRTGALDAIRQRIGQRPVYLCFDMDIFDPSCAPGVCTPVGRSVAKEGLALLRRLRAELRGLRCQHRVAAAGCRAPRPFWPRPSCRNSARWRRPRCSGIRKDVRPDPARWRHSYIPGEIHDTQIHSARPGVALLAQAARARARWTTCAPTRH